MKLIGGLLALGLAGALVGSSLTAAVAAPQAAAPTPLAVAAAHDSLHMRGQWKATRKYHENDVVRYGNASYVARKAHKDKVPTRKKYWQVLAMDGATGAAGANGAPGAPGAAGAVGASGPNLVVKDSSGAVLGKYMGAVAGDIGMAVEIDGGIYIYLSNGAFIGTLEDGILSLIVGSNVFYMNDPTCLSTPYAAFESAAVGMSYVGSVRRYVEYTNRLTGLLTGLEARAAYKLTANHRTQIEGTDLFYVIDARDGACRELTGADLAVLIGPLLGRPAEMFQLVAVATPHTVPGPLMIS